MSTAVDKPAAAAELSKVPKKQRAEVVKEATRGGAETATKKSIKEAHEKIASKVQGGSADASAGGRRSLLHPG